MSDEPTYTEKIPSYLNSYIATQDPSLYTPIDHASWRYILKLSKAFFSENAHQKYLTGLKETGISMDRIPLIEEMDACLKKYNWRAVSVSGFIPPAVFMEFLSLGVLPIACDMRRIENLAYTPAPDIVHEAAGHAPIVVDAEYAAYLRSYGEISKKAIYSNQDMAVYNSIRHLSEVKENPEASVKEIESAQKQLDQALRAVTFDSEAALLARMGWWTFEYGLVGDLASPKIYGAGLLSSLSESYHCFDPSIKKVPFSIDCIRTSYDITRPQPQLYVARDFKVLKNVLRELEDQMAFKQGGIGGLEKAKQAQTTTTVELDSGIQIGGQLMSWIESSENGEPCYLQFQGPTQLAWGGNEIEGQGPQFHPEGFGTPLEAITHSDLSRWRLELGRRSQIQFESGIILDGKVIQILRREGHPVLLSFADCTVKKGDVFLFRPEWGKYDMICGKKVVSVFGGPPDRQGYLNLNIIGAFPQKPGRQKTNLTENNRHLCQLYQSIRNLRQQAKWDSEALSQLTEIHQTLEEHYPREWLLRFEILEIQIQLKMSFSWGAMLVKRLEEISEEPSLREVIQRGLTLFRKV